MGAYDDLFPGGYVDDVTTLDAATLNDLFQVLPMQGEGALEAIGEGIAEGFDGSAVGLDFAASVGKAIIPFTMTTASGLVYVAAPSGLEVALPDDTANLYLWLVAQMPDTTDYDARKDGAVVLVYTLTDTQPANSLPLEAGHTSGGAYTQDEDRRVYTSAGAVAALQTAVAALEVEAADHETRIADLEATGGSETGGYRFYENMPLNVGDPTTPPQLMDSKDAALKAEILEEVGGGAGTESLAAEFYDVDSVNQSYALFALVDEIEARDPTQLVYLTQVDSVLVVWGKTGDGSNGTADLIDRTNSTWPGL
jgi:hypothetical protein